ncbi:MAG: non-homologous end-joining DNA ligase, partial [Rhizobiales bacterium]|nr:non-homologous end-joining DNA ligase [Hyphomicrobiales bacterium]
QKHAATRLHYDFRLEHNGVLWSWAVTRGPSLDPSEKRLAVHVEDHPLDYGDFEGTIPKGEYGGGSVIVWDNGEWIPEGDPEAGMKKGHLDFELKGNKLNGRWHLVRLKPRRGEKCDNWLLIKSDDSAARRSGDILEDAPQSVKSGLTIDEIGKNEKADVWHSDKPAGGGSFAKRSPAKKIRRAGKQARMPDFVILDGEIVVLADNGISSFSALQAALSGRQTEKFICYVFDLLYLDGTDVSGEPLADRKERLRDLLKPLGEQGPLRYSEHFTEPGKTMLAHACRMGLEGVVSKRADAAYHSGRGHDWIKSKCTQRQEFVIAGYLPSEKTGRGLRSLIVGYNEGGELKSAGHVGTGFSAKVGDDLKKKLDRLKRETSPLTGPGSREKGAIWVDPDLVAEVEFRSWTADRILRHASFQGLREDKPAEDVVQEEPEDTADNSAKHATNKGASRRASAKKGA